MTNNDNAKVLRRIYEEVMTRGNFDALNELVAKDCVDHNPMPGQRPGRDGIREMLQAWRAAFPDLKLKVEELIADGDCVCGVFRGTGTHTAPLMGLQPTRKTSSITGIDVVTIRDGKVAEWRHVEDQLGMFIQLGVVSQEQLFGGVPSPQMSHATGGQPQPGQARAQRK